jgi:hypothetical protein
VFPAYPELARRIYDFFCRVTHHKGSGALATASFLQVAEKFMAIMSDERQTELYLKVCNSTPLDAAVCISRQTLDSAAAIIKVSHSVPTNIPTFVSWEFSLLGDIYQTTHGNNQIGEMIFFNGPHRI